MQPLAFVDLETTGTSATQDSITEIGIVLVDDDGVREWNQLLHPEMRIPLFIEQMTGISNAMLKGQPPCETVMSEFAEFIAGYNIVAHNASFDRRFLDAELKRAHRAYEGSCCCSLLVSRRIYQDSPNHRLQTLVSHAGIPETGKFHRALADAEMTAHLWMSMIGRIRRQYGITEVFFDQLSELSRIDKLYTHRYLTLLAKGREVSGG